MDNKFLFLRSRWNVNENSGVDDSSECVNYCTFFFFFFARRSKNRPSIFQMRHCHWRLQSINKLTIQRIFERKHLGIRAYCVIVIWWKYTCIVRKKKKKTVYLRSIKDVSPCPVRSLLLSVDMLNNETLKLQTRN